MNTKEKVHIISLGCARNKVDSEQLLGALAADNWLICQEPELADILIVNTCGFIEAAKEESIATILDLIEVKRQRPGVRLVVAGCLSQRYKNQLAKGLPEVDIFVGTDQWAKIPELLRNSHDGQRIFTKRSNFLADASHARYNSLGPLSAYVKVAEGCEHSCSFCIIPAIRGKLRSRQISDVHKEVSNLAAQGVKEVNLIAQDLAAFGRDRHQDDLLPLLKSLSSIEEIRWIRLLYMYPENISPEFLDFFANEPKIVKYLDVPVQHASDQVLMKMRRDIDQKGLRRIFTQLRQRVPNITLRTSVMVGFPGESAADFAELQNFCEDIAFDHLGCFQYSQEEGTPAGRMPQQIPTEIKAERQHQIMTAQQLISERRLKQMIGSQQVVLVEKPNEDQWHGRLSCQAPEVDGIVKVKGVSNAGFHKVKIESADAYDLEASKLPS